MPTAILKPYYFRFRRRVKRVEDTKHGFKRDALLLSVVLLIMLSIFAGAVMILSAIASDGLMKLIIPGKIIGLLFYAFFVLLLVSNTISAMGNIYTSENMNLFLYTPLSSIRLFSAKLIETLVETSLMFFVFISPVGLAFCYTLDPKPGFLLASTLAAIPFLVIPSALGVIFATFAARFSSFFWKRGLFLFTCLFGAGVFALGSLISLLKDVKFERGGQNAIVQVIGLFDNPNPTWLPSRWISDIITYYISGSIDSGGEKILLLVSTAVGVTCLAYIIFDLFLLPVRSAAGVYERQEEGTLLGKSKIDPLRRALEGIYNNLPINVQLRAIILKDLTSLIRDRAQSLQLLMYVGFALVYLILITFMSAALNMAPVAQQVWWAFLSGINILFAGFIITAVMTRLVYPSISLEGKAFWILITGPLKLDRLLLAKYCCWFPLAFVVSITLVLAGVLAIHPELVFALSGMYIGAALSIGCTGLAIGVGALFASFEWESPNQISAGFGTLVLLLSSLTLVVVTAIPGSLMTLLILAPAARVKFGGEYWRLTFALCAAIVIGINIATAYYACKQGAISLGNQTKE